MVKLERALIGMVHLSIADALIVGTWVKRDGDVRNSIDPARVRKLVQAARA